MIIRRWKLFAAALVALPLFTFGAATSASNTSKVSPPPTGAKTAKPLHVSFGQPVKLADYLVPGKTVVFDFYSDYCPPCVRVAPALEKLHAKRADIVVVKVDINRPGMKGIDWKSPVAAQFGLRSIPHFKVYGPDGKLLAEDGMQSSKAREMVMRWVE
ncbi:MAG: thioredoxin family protein [Opitutaceae bacterium]|nr:thioredoxin family protein [Opitutaceae bacterium]